MKHELKRLSVEIPINLHAEIKQLAARRNISMRTAVLRALHHYIVEEKKYDKPDDSTQETL